MKGNTIPDIVAAQTTHITQPQARARVRHLLQSRPQQFHPQQLVATAAVDSWRELLTSVTAICLVRLSRQVLIKHGLLLDVAAEGGATDGALIRGEPRPTGPDGGIVWVLVRQHIPVRLQIEPRCLDAPEGAREGLRVVG